MNQNLMLAAALFLSCAGCTRSESVSVNMNRVQPGSIGESVGTVMISDQPQGLQLKLDLKGLPPGPHGFHVHENASCDEGIKEGKVTAALKAGEHYDPAHSGKHMGPEGSGHAGDLPFFTVAPDGTAKELLLAPKLKVSDVRKRSLMIHEGGDNYSDTPAPLGGGGARIACGVIH